MNQISEAELKRLFPHASRSTLKANYENSNPSGVVVPDTQQRQRQKKLGTDHARETQGTERPIVRFTLCRGRLLDVDAKYGSVKDLLDGLQYAGLIRGDKEGQITLEVNQQKVKTFAEEQTIIEIL